MAPRVSVVMPVYNGERFLRPAIESILGQTFDDFEFLILDDGSSDGSGAIAAEYAARDPRITLMRHPANTGVAGANNALLANARCHYVAQLDHDDVSLPGRLAQQVQWLDDHPAVGVVGSWFEVIDENDRRTSGVVQPPTAPGLVAWCMYFYNPLAHPAVMMRRDLVLQAGGHAPTDGAASDYALWCRMRWRTQFANVGSLLLLLRKHGANHSLVEEAQVLEVCVRSLQALVRQTLGRTVPEPILRGLWSRKYPSARVAYGVAALINALATVALAGPGLSAEEKAFVRNDAAERLRGPLQRLPARRWSWSRWRTLLWLRRLNPIAANAELTHWLGANARAAPG